MTEEANLDLSLLLITCARTAGITPQQATKLLDELVKLPNKAAYRLLIQRAEIRLASMNGEHRRENNKEHFRRVHQHVVKRVTR